MEISDIDGQKLLNANFSFLEGTDILKAIDLYFEKNILRFEIDNDTDEIILKLEINQHIQNKKDISKNIFLKYYNKQLIFSWECINSRGYFDAFLLAFENCLPNILISSATNTFDLFELNKV